MSPGAGETRWDFDSPAAAVEALAGRLSPVEVETVGLERAAGRVLAAALAADRPSPAIDVSAMDGYALRLDEAKRGGRITVAGEARIGEAPPEMPSSGAVRIMTGAAVPPGADLVVRRERVAESAQEIEIEPDVAASLAQGANVRRRGENIGAGETVIEPGGVIDAATIGALAHFGCAEVAVHRCVRIGVIVTGDEVEDVGAALPDWRLRDSNGPALAALLGAPGWAAVAPPRRAPDEREALRRAVESSVNGVDALFLTGGVSAGDRDYVPDVLRQVGAEIVFHKLPQRPGKPVLGAVVDGRVPVLGLPGNPVSVLVTARRMGAPALRRLAGVVRTPSSPLVELVNPDDKRLDLWWHRLVSVESPGRAALTPGRGSGDVAAAARSDGFVEIPPGEAGAGPWPYRPWTL